MAGYNLTCFAKFEESWRKRIINVRQNEKEEAITNKLLELHFLIYKIAT
jgi:hypothetical protein